jgi:hypothetical protein
MSDEITRLRALVDEITHTAEHWADLYPNADGDAPGPFLKGARAAAEDILDIINGFFEEEDVQATVDAEGFDW